MTEHHPQPSAHHSGEHDPERAVTSPERAGEPTLHPKVWIGSLADYNAGTLTGDWVDAATDADTLIASAKAILARSEEPGAEEWAIFDFDDFDTWHPGEYEDLTIVARVARGIAEHGPAFAAWADLHDAEPDLMDSFSDAYLGAYDSTQAWAETMLDDLGTTAEVERILTEKVGDMARYIHLDTGAWAHDAWLSGDIAIVTNPDGGVWVFDGRL